MIKFTLRCAADHHFESWFSSNDAFEKLVTTKQVTCPTCGETKVEKALMAPAVSTTKGKDISTFATKVSPTTPQEAAAIAMVDVARKIRKKLETEADYVGENFAKEARARHETAEQSDKTEKANKPVWGEASPEEARDLIEDGIAILPVPKLPEDEN